MTTKNIRLLDEVNPMAEGKYVGKRDTQWTLVVIGVSQLDYGREVLGYILIGAGIILRLIEMIKVK